MSTDATTTDGFRVGRRVKSRKMPAGEGCILKPDKDRSSGWWVINWPKPLLPSSAHESDLELLPDDEPDAPATPEPAKHHLLDGLVARHVFEKKQQPAPAVAYDPREPEAVATHDPVNHPKHYTSHPSGIECIEITRHMGFNLGNAMKYVWRADLKGNSIEDLRKAAWYINDEIEKRQKLTTT